MKCAWYTDDEFLSFLEQEHLFRKLLRKLDLALMKNGKKIFSRSLIYLGLCQHKFNEIYGWNWNNFLMTTYYIFLKVIIFVWKNVGWCISIQRRRIPAKMQFQRCFDWKYIKKCTIIKICKFFIQNLWTKKNIYGLSLK